MSRPYIPEHIDVRLDKIASKLKCSRNSATIIVLNAALKRIKEDEIVDALEDALIPIVSSKKKPS